MSVHVALPTHCLQFMLVWNKLFSLLLCNCGHKSAPTELELACEIIFVNWSCYWRQHWLSVAARSNQFHACRLAGVLAMSDNRCHLLFRRILWDFSNVVVASALKLRIVYTVFYNVRMVGAVSNIFCLRKKWLFLATAGLAGFVLYDCEWCFYSQISQSVCARVLVRLDCVCIWIAEL